MAAETGPDALDTAFYRVEDSVWSNATSAPSPWPAHDRVGPAEQGRSFVSRTPGNMEVAMTLER